MNHNIENLIKDKLDIITVGRLNLNIPEKTKYYKRNEFTCSKCDGELIECTNDEKYDDACGEMADGIYCVSCELTDNDAHYLCKDCKYYYVRCRKCSSEDEIMLCQFLGFSGYMDENRVVYRVVDREEIKKLRARGIEKYFKDKRIKYYINNENLMEFAVENKEPYYTDDFDKFFKGNDISGRDDIIFHNVVDKNLEFFDISNCLPTEPLQSPRGISEAPLVRCGWI